MTYKYSLDSRTVGDTWFHKSTFEFLQKGLIRLRDRLQEWNSREVEPPYRAEVADLTRMIDWSAQRLARLTSEYDDLHVGGISVGSLRYLKAGAVLQILEAEEQLQREIGTLPSGVIEARRRAIARMKKMAEVGVFADLEPADCLWEVAASAPVRTPVSRPGGQSPWDLFICHATEDKEPFVRQLVERLLTETRLGSIYCECKSANVYDAAATARLARLSAALDAEYRQYDWPASVAGCSVVKGGRSWGSIVRGRRSVRGGKAAGRRSS